MRSRPGPFQPLSFVPDELSRFDDSLDIVLIGCVTVTVKVACDRTFAFVRFTRQRGVDDTMRLIRT